MVIRKKREPTAVFTPNTEPYLGRQSVHHFDRIIIWCLETNQRFAAYTRTHPQELSNLQSAACQIIPQGVNLALGIRELVRQGYLFGAVVLMRPLIERAAIISYLHVNPKAIALWQKGWEYRDRPSLATMLQTMSGEIDISIAKQVCDTFNHIVHGDPIGSSFNLVELRNGGLGYSVSKVLNQGDLCDFICYQSYCYLIVLTSMMGTIFPEVSVTEKPAEVTGNG